MMEVARKERGKREKERRKNNSVSHNIIIMHSITPVITVQVHSDCL